MGEIQITRAINRESEWNNEEKGKEKHEEDN